MTSPAPRTEWRQIVRKYQEISWPRTVWSFVSSFAAFAVTWFLAYRSLAGPYWITLCLSALLGGLRVRIFTIQHDCGHGSFSRSRRLNDLTGLFCSLFNIVPYREWKKHHSYHHNSAGDLGRRGHGDIWTITVKEYQGMSRRQRVMYRLFRSPLIMLGVGPSFLFLLMRRVPSETPRAWKLERRGVYLTNVALAAVILGMGTAMGFRNYFSIYLPSLLVMSNLGSWLFFIQHQFRHTYWAPSQEWNWVKAALQGSSFYDLPAVLRWFGNSVNYHHVHHLGPTIPAYNLKRCHDENPFFHTVPRIRFWAAFASARLALWDDARQVLISFNELRSRNQKGTMPYVRRRIDGTV